MRVIKPRVGGGFGGKLDVFPHEACCCKLAEKTGRPVKMVLTREEVFEATRVRHPITIEIESAFGADGTLAIISTAALTAGPESPLTPLRRSGPAGWRCSKAARSWGHLLSAGIRSADIIGNSPFYRSTAHKGPPDHRLSGGLSPDQYRRYLFLDQFCLRFRPSFLSFIHLRYQ